MAKRYSIKEMAELFAEEMGIDFNSYTVAEILDMGIEKIKSPKNHEIEEWIDNIKDDYKKLQVEMEPHIETTLKDKPVFDVLKKIWTLQTVVTDEDVQDIALRLEGAFKDSRIKKKTNRKTGMKKETSQLYSKIQKQFYQLREQGKTQKETLNILSTRFSRTPQTILKITKKK